MPVCLLGCWRDLIFGLAGAAGISPHSSTTFGLGMRLSCACAIPSPLGWAQERCRAPDTAGCILQLGECVRIPAPCRASTIPQPEGGKRDGECEEGNDAGERWTGGSHQQPNSTLEKRTCKSSNPSVHLVGETKDNFRSNQPPGVKRKDKILQVFALTGITGNI